VNTAGGRRLAAEALSTRGRAAEAAGDFGEAVSALLDAALAFEEAGDEDAARVSAKRVLALWSQFEEAKNLVMEPARARKSEDAGRKPLRRLPRAGERPAPGGPPEEARAPPVTALPSMFIEMHAEALRLAGDERAARKRLAEAAAAVEAEVARRRAGQEWSEAFSAAQSLVRLAKRAGGEGGIADARRAFIALAREAAAESLTAEYLARGKEDLPLAALDAALGEARALGDEALIRAVGADERSVAAREADLLDALSSEATAAEAILSWDDAWTFIDSRPEVKRALLHEPALAGTLAGPLRGLAGLALSHPARVELREFEERLESVVARARARAPVLRARAAAR
jgi:hypothetical protein